MIHQLLQKNVQEFIEQHEHDDEQQLLLKHKTLFDIPASTIAWQIVGRRKAITKIPLYYNAKQIVYPPGLNLEQSSSEETAAFKASILDKELNQKNSIIDLTGGFGVDTLFCSKVFNQVKYIEPNAELLSYARNNHRVLGSENIEHINSKAEDFLNSFIGQPDCFFIDPSRRTNSNQKVFKLADCEPNVIDLLPRIFEHSKHLLVKAAPLLDLQQALLELKAVKQIWIVSVKNEVKELLFFCEKNFSTEPTLTAVNLSSDHQPFSFRLSDEKKCSS